MDRIQSALSRLQALFLKAAEVMAVLVALIVLVYIFLGEDSGPYVTNLSLLIFAITPQTIIAIAIVICLYIALKKRV
jgi:hypothetical protein